MQKKGYKKSYRKRATGFKKAVANIARKVTQRQAETKTGSYAVTAGNIGTNGTLLDLWSTLAAGTAQNQRIGDKIKALGGTLRMRVGLDGNYVTNNQDYCAVRFMVVRATRPLTLADMPSFYGSYDPEIMRPIVDKYINFTTNSRNRNIKKYIKINRFVHYDGAGSTSKNWTYLFVLPVAPAGMTGSAGCFFDLNFQRFFKDI